MNVAKKMEIAFKDYINEYGREKFDKLLLKFMKENFISEESNHEKDHKTENPKAISEKSISVTVYQYEDKTHRIGISSYSLGGKDIVLQDAIFMLETAKNKLINDYINSNQ